MDAQFPTSATGSETASTQVADKLMRKDIADILFKKYTLLKTEIHLHIGNYKKHSKHIQLVATAIFAAVSYLIVEKHFEPSDSNILIWAAGIFLATSLLCYFVYDILDSVYDINVLGERMIILEKEINEVSGRNLLVWETEISGLVHSQRPFPHVFPPFVLVQVYVTIMTLLALVVFPVVAAGYILVYVDINTGVLWKKSLLIFDVIWAVSSAAVLLYVIVNQFAVRENAKRLMQEVAARTWRKIEE